MLRVVHAARGPESHDDAGASGLTSGRIRRSTSGPQSRTQRCPQSEWFPVWVSKIGLDLPLLSRDGSWQDEEAG